MKHTARLLLMGLGFSLAVGADEVSGPTVDLNHADAAQIAEVLEGVGEAKAAAIVAYRESHGPFSSVEQLDEVEGIGPRTIERNRAHIVLGDP